MLPAFMILCLVAVQPKKANPELTILGPLLRPAALAVEGYGLPARTLLLVNLKAGQATFGQK